MKKTQNWGQSCPNPDCNCYCKNSQGNIRFLYYSVKTRMSLNTCLTTLLQNYKCSKYPRLLTRYNLSYETYKI